MTKTAIALGTFDGVHLGHIKVLKTAVESGYYPIAVAFREPPKAFFLNQGVILTPENEKTKLIKNIGIKKIEYIDFFAVKDLSPKDFVNLLIEKYQPAQIVCGYNYTFGKGGMGDIILLKKLCSELGVELKVIDKVSLNGTPISSTLIRNLLKEGKIREANKFLNRPFSITAPVIKGDTRGRTLGFPTVNQLYENKNAIIKFGVYITKITIEEKEYFGMTNIGVRPTFPLNNTVCETNIFDFSEELYSKEISLELLDFIREEKKFSSKEALIKAIENDKAIVKGKIKEGF